MLKAFLSSTYRDPAVPHSAEHLSIRWRLHEYAKGRPNDFDLWIAEYSNPPLKDQGWIEILDVCVRELRSVDLFIAVLFQRGGAAIEMSSRLGAAAASVLELELFHAFLAKTPALFFTVEGYEPEPALRNIIAIARRATHPSQWVHGTEAEVEAAIKARLEDRVGVPPRPIAGFIDAASEVRSFANVGREMASTRLSLIQGFAPADRGPLSLDRVDALLAALDPPPGTAPLTMPQQLTRLWLALRELAKAEALDRPLADRWASVARGWTSPAAWLGLHGPFGLGALAALHTQQQLAADGWLERRLMPYGAYASEAYSIAKLSESRDWKVRRFWAAAQLATRQAREHPADPTGAFGIRASALLQLAALGRPWLAIPALVDYRAMLRRRERAGASDAAIGEAMAELGAAEFALGRWLAWTRAEGLQKLREGVRLMRDDPGAGPGFVLRGEEKLIAALRAAGLEDEVAAHERSREALAGASQIRRDPGLL